MELALVIGSAVRPLGVSVSRHRYAYVLVILGLNLVVFSGVYLDGIAFPFDFPATYYALPAYWIASVSAGEWPSWVPYLGMGYPFAAHPQSGAFYPPFWVFPLLRTPYTLHAASMLQALHVLAGAIGAFLLAARLFRSHAVALVAGVAYMVYGGFYSNAQHADIIRAFALLPWLFWAFTLQADQASSRQVTRWTLTSNLSASSLAIPGLVYMLVTGAYVGNAIAFLFVLPLFLAVQALRNFGCGQASRGVLFDVVVVSALAVLGVGMASGFLLPLAAFSSELTRSTNYLDQPRWYFQLRDVYELALSSNYLRPKDHSMYAMQLPLALLPFCAFVPRAAFLHLAPYLAVAAAALLMSLDSFGAVSGLMIRLVPFLGFSRFPVGDYRTLVALPVLLVLCAGLKCLLDGSNRGWRVAARYAMGLTIVTVLAMPAVVLAWLSGVGELATTVLLLQLAPALVFCAFLPLTRRPGAWHALPVGLALASVASAAPVLTDLKVYWQVSEQYIEQRAGISPWTESGWRANETFDRQLASRPARSRADNEFAISWRGYLAGEFMADDYGGAVIRSRQVVEQDPELRAFVEGPSTLVARACSGSECASLIDAQVPIGGRDPAGFEWRPIEYGRSTVSYHLSLPTSALVVENELFSTGWRARMGTGEWINPVEIDGGLRGWILPGGDYDLNLVFDTPLLPIGLVFSALAFLAYGVTIAVGIAHDCSNRTIRTRRD